MITTPAHEVGNKHNCKFRASSIRFRWAERYKQKTVCWMKKSEIMLKLL